MEKLTFERASLSNGYSKRHPHKDSLIISNHSYQSLQVEIRVEGYLLDLLTLKSGQVVHYDLRFPSISSDAQIEVQEVTEDIDMTLEENRHYQDFGFFGRL